MDEKETLRLYVDAMRLRGGRGADGKMLRRSAEIRFIDDKGAQFGYLTRPGERLDMIYDAWENGDALTVVANVAPEYRFNARELLGVDKIEFAKDA